MPMVGPNIAQGLNARGSGVSQDLNQDLNQDFIYTFAVSTAYVDVAAFDDRLTEFETEGSGFRPDEDSFHKKPGSDDSCG